MEVELIEDEHNLIRQLNNDGYRPGWARTALLRATLPKDDDLDQPPPPYNDNGSHFNH